MEKRLEILDLSDAVREIVGECELTGKRTLFQRNGRPVAILASYDEYVALRETIAIAADATLREHLDAADEEIRRGAMLLPEELLVE
ncbi:MAG TPA: type II toxin-antitoxin system Phd/YefM family antitoxin [Thermoanaerobaculia bacterium]|jgi:PHD/YefM family antitoxin component YafN of YafNO toxin-antitoxin module